MRCLLLNGTIFLGEEQNRGEIRVEMKLIGFQADWKSIRIMIWVKDIIHIGVRNTPRIDGADALLSSMVEEKGSYNGKKTNH